MKRLEFIFELHTFKLFESLRKIKSNLNYQISIKSTTNLIDNIESFYGDHEKYI